MNESEFNNESQTGNGPISDAVKAKLKAAAVASKNAIVSASKATAKAVDKVAHISEKIDLHKQKVAMSNVATTSTVGKVNTFDEKSDNGLSSAKESHQCGVHLHVNDAMRLKTAIENHFKKTKATMVAKFTTILNAKNFDDLQNAINHIDTNEIKNTYKKLITAGEIENINCKVHVPKLDGKGADIVDGKIKAFDQVKREIIIDYTLETKNLIKQVKKETHSLHLKVNELCIYDDDAQSTGTGSQAGGHRKKIELSESETYLKNLAGGKKVITFAELGFKENTNVFAKKVGGSKPTIFNEISMTSEYVHSANGMSGGTNVFKKLKRNQRGGEDEEQDQGKEGICE